MFGRIRRRLTMGYVGILALILVLFGVIVVASFYRQVTITQDRLLLQKAQASASSPLEERGGYGRIETATDFDIALEEVTFVGLAEQDSLLEETLREELREEIQLEGPHSLSVALGLPYFEMAQRAGREERNITETVAGPEGGVRVMNVPVYNQSGDVIVVLQAAQSRQAVWQTVNSLVFALVPVGVGALALAAVGGLFMSRRAIRPVRESFERQRAFIADASHELKTPLALIKVNAEVLSGRAGSEEAALENRELVEDLLGETDRMSALLSGLLTLARLDAGQLPTSEETFDLAGTLSEVVDRFHTRAASAEVQLEVLATGKLPVLGDRSRTEQILAILLDNALTYTPPNGGITVTGRTRGATVEAIVKDTGPGIPPEHLDRIFERFYRADTARSRTISGGTGLGLAIARDLARAQKGNLSAENAKGEGARFRLTLPKG